MNYHDEQVRAVKTDELHFDYRNPRLIEFGVTKSTPREEILQLLWDEMGVEEIVLSIVASGFHQYEPLIVITEREKYVVVEGNRRLAAVNAMLMPDFLDNYGSTGLPDVPNAIRENIEELPVVLVESREAVWRYIGFKHVNGPAKWGSYAKAQYIADVHNEYGISLTDIALQIGDRHRTVQRLYRALMVLEQAEREGRFDRRDIMAPRLYFSHLYTGLDYDGIKQFLGVKDAELESDSPIPADHLDNLEELLIWMFGSRKRQKSSVIRSQNPHLRQLDEVLLNREAVAALRRNDSIEIAFEISQPDVGKFEQSIFDAKRSIQRAQTYLSTGYDGDVDLLDTAQSILKAADTLYQAMKIARSAL